MDKEKSQDNFEQADCPLCGSREFSKLFDARDWYYGAPGVFTISRCRSCGLVMQNPRPRPEVMADYYPSDYEPHKLAGEGLDVDKFVEGQESRRDFLERYAKNGRNLDVGSGDGRFLLCLKRAGWDACGCEFVEKMAGFQREKLGLDVRDCDLLSAGFEADSFDSVTLWSVLEHLYEPVKTVSEIRRILKPGGVAVIGVPNFNSLERLLFGQYWYSLSVPYHLYFFTPATIARVAALSGMKLDRTIFATTATSMINSAKKILELRSGTGNESEEGTNGSPPPSREQDHADRESGTIKESVFRYLFVPFMKTLDALHVGGTTNYILRKPL